MPFRVLVTGATGLLGRQVFAALQGLEGVEVIGTAFSRAKGAIVKADLTSEDSIRLLYESHRPHMVIHCAAERRPDNITGAAAVRAEQLNVGSVWALARFAAATNALFFLISTDYVFAGTDPPYKHSDFPQPTNRYGELKLRGEYAAMAAHGGACVLRVPVLYGPTQRLDESAITVLAAKARQAAACAAEGEGTVTVDHWAVRYPTFTPDVGKVLAAVAVKAQAARAAAQAAEGEHCHSVRWPFKGIYHWSGSEATTKFELSRMFADLLGLDVGTGGGSVGLVGSPDPPADGVPRPRDAHLDRSRLLSDLGWTEEQAEDACTPVREGLLAVLRAAGEPVPAAAAAAGAAGQ